MKKVALVVCSLTLMLSNFAFAEPPQVVGAGQNGFAVSMGYNGAQLNYKEIRPVGGGVLDKDTGWLNGLTTEARYDGKVVSIPFFMRVDFDYLTSNSAKYTGQLQNGTPIVMPNSETIYKTEFDLGYKFWSPQSVTLAPYMGVGYRDWERGKDALPNYKESYTWWYGTVGANLAYRATDSLLVGLDAGLLYPFGLEMETNIAGLVDNAKFHIKSRLGYQVKVPLSYDVYKIGGLKLFTFLTPYYERWNVAQSPVVTLTFHGVPVAGAVEPTSHTDLYGVRAGVGIHF